jgi:hypothetical protein
MDVEVSTEVVEVDIDIDEPALMPAESGSQPVAEHAATTDAELEEVTEELLPAHAEASAPPAPQPPANEVLEPSPSSSPRPIASESAATYEEESAPRHTPPPASGKQVAAASVKPEARKSSAPPADNHAILGGWREPGLAPPREAERVASAPPPEARMPSAPPAARMPSAPPPARVPSRPEITRADLPDGSDVATIEGAPPAFAPLSFGEMLDATLGL